ncbi:MAG: drug/metabolite exporter YedA [Deltaproteobacteria bacterium]|nr:drug/metabolite exporter YedA [Deltaproteobacteria bacterium]
MDYTGQTESPERARVIAALLSVYILWGSTYLAIRIALESFPPFFMAGFRFFVTGVLLYLALRVKGVKNPSWAQWAAGGVVGVLLLAGGNGGVVFAEQWISSSFAALGVATVPLWTVLFAGIWKRWPTRIEWAGIVLGLGGVALLNMEGDMRAHPAGAAALIVAAVFWAFGSAWGRNLPLPSGLMAAAVEMICGGFVFLIMSLVAGESVPAEPTLRSVAALFYLMVFGALLGFSAYTYLINRVRPSLATSYAYVNPVIAVTIGVLLAGEKVTAAGFAAMLVIVTAVMIVIFGPKRR